MNIHLRHHGSCIDDAECDMLADDLYATLSSGVYDWPASILPLDDLDAYLAAHRTARKRAHRARNLGYTFVEIDRRDHVDAIHAINTSAPKRQGRPMTAGYLARPEFASLPDYPCRRHSIRCYGVHAPDNLLVAYLVLYVCGDVALISQILGHADHLANDVMYLLCAESFRDALERSGPLIVSYNRWDSGTDGLRYFKERLGFRPGRVAWCL